MPTEFLPRFTHPIMKRAMEFIDEHIENRKVLIHCNQGFSRPPSIAVLYLARIGKINRSSFREAKDRFSTMYSDYQPGRGIELYMEHNWKDLLIL